MILKKCTLSNFCIHAVGRFGESFGFGEAAGDVILNIPFNNNFFVFLSNPFTFYESQERFFYVCMYVHGSSFTIIYYLCGSLRGVY